jgi:hypothetical protein
MIRFTLFCLFNLLGAGCLLAAIISGAGLTDVSFLYILGGLIVASLGMGAIVVLTELLARNHGKPVMVSTRWGTVLATTLDPKTLHARLNQPWPQS